MADNDLKYVQPVQVVEVKQPTDISGIAWRMLDKVAQGSTAVIFALVLLWWFSKDALSKSVSNFNDLIVTLRSATRDNTETQKQLNETLKHMNEEDIKTASALGKVDSKLKLIRSLLLEVRQNQTGVARNMLPPIEIIDLDEDSDLTG